MWFYDNSISPGTKINLQHYQTENLFYDNSISPGTKIRSVELRIRYEFYDNSISPGTKIGDWNVEDPLQVLR